MKRDVVLFALAMIFLVCSVFLAETASAFKTPPKPADNIYYVDEANLISPDDRIKINNIGSKLWQEKQVPLLVVTIPSLAAMDASDATVESYTRTLFNYWGIGSQQNNNGILLLISKEDRGARIEFGGSWGRKYDDAASNIMQTDIIPAFKRGEFSQGIVAGVTSLSALASGVYTVQIIQLKWWHTLLIGLAGVALVVIIISLFKSGRSGWAWALIIMTALFIWQILRSVRVGFGKGKDGGGRFGGGSSGGGGSGGSW